MIRVCPLGDLPPGAAVRVVAEGIGEDGGSAVPIAVFNADGRLYAIDDTCTHQDASLADGWLEGCQVECPLHASCFDLRTGRPTGPPAKKAVGTYPVSVLDGVIWVDAAATTAGRGADAPARPAEVA
ncbi:MAG TPA: bifunctional 3-phenylpropionate/cinnamic acid dioxygenase ferredoxin subunit [Pseudonocardiaceae bacterium]|jgi:3-phenylpropionate/trans-cinnamate dioxygenase ferredoxin subunit|nr:bifunctional 3-phenylpropionate/cinnamic acid dioxygenase ferredoxin subunit [Pseudonocardiaceae bacterium]